MKKDRGKVWLGAGVIVENNQGDWLVVKKTYSGLKGVWSIPAGFVQEGETVDMAAIREVKEETCIDIQIIGMAGFRSGVIRGEISDNMAVFYAKKVDENQICIAQENEISEVCWLSPEQLAHDQTASLMLQEMARNRIERHTLAQIDSFNPGDVFGYTMYRLFMNREL